MSLAETYRSVLRRAAEEFSEHEPVPIDLTLLCHRLGVRVARYPFEKIKARAILVYGRIMPEIWLRATSDGSQSYRPYERFAIAHEIGHLVLRKECGASLSDQSPYWLHESLCDEFAADLLIPERQLQPLVERTPNEASAQFGLCVELATTCNVTWETAATRLANFDHSLVMLGLKFEKNGDGDPNLRIAFTTLRSLQNKRLPLPPSVNHAFSWAPNSKRMSTFDVRDLSLNPPLDLDIQDAVVQKLPRGRYSALLKLASQRLADPAE